tara:strand:+ start:275 stop:1162 length:888 start_codon:yes stop_codon:yes gene_type:complete
MKNTKKNVYEIVTEQVIEKIESGQLAPWQKPWKSVGHRPANLITKKPYKGINAFLLAFNDYESPYYLTYKQAKEKGGNVKKGEKANLVTYWQFLYFKNDKPLPSKMPQAEKERIADKKIPLLKYYNVFNVEQCEGVEYPTIKACDLNENEKLANCESIIEAMPNKPGLTFGGGRAFYRPATDNVTMPKLETFDGSSEYYSTFFHELAHSTGHSSRLNRQGIEEIAAFGDAVYSKEELIAEFTACFLCGETGILQRTVENSSAYLKSWLKVLKSDSKMLVTAASQAEKAANYILNK